MKTSEQKLRIEIMELARRLYEDHYVKLDATYSVQDDRMCHSNVTVSAMPLNTMPDRESWQVIWQLQGDVPIFRILTLLRNAIRAQATL